jgi:general secretion pathway protein K
VFYLGLQPPYRAFNRPIASVSELRMVNGMAPEIYAKLEPYVAALPRAEPFNVSTVAKEKPELIMCLAPNVGRTEAVQALENRGTAGFTSVQDFQQEPVLAPFNIPAAGLTVSSNYFMVTSHVQVGRSTYTTYSLLERNASGVRTMMRAQGTY